MIRLLEPDHLPNGYVKSDRNKRPCFETDPYAWNPTIAMWTKCGLRRGDEIPQEGHFCEEAELVLTLPREPLDPKAAIGATKPPLHLIPPAGNVEMAKALQCGADKYGQRNWMSGKVAMTTYLAAMKRHIDCILDGEDIDPESGAHHLGHVMAGCGIVLDAQRHGMLVDDRVLPPKKQA